MDDSCAVCAEALEWVAYGSCGHREVCSTCIIRLRFICNDRCCCICKSESTIVFVTRALGEYTRLINDFSALPPNPVEGQAGEYWFHEGAQAYFDDLDHFKMIKAICRLSCNVCERNEQRNGGSKRHGDFDSIEQLKNHLFHQHRLFICSLCFEGRKIFISEQKLYNRAQLKQHVRTGDSVVDGSESERGGFTGHPMCEFCQNPFYGDNELYLHMSTEHFTCHICQRQHPGKYEYYDDYDDLEIHFRQQHFLCEDEACLAKKFIVFASEPEMKRHEAMEHGGRMSQSKRNAAPQIPTSFLFRQSTEQGRHGRRHRICPHSSKIQHSMAIRNGLETFNPVRSRDISSNTQTISVQRETRKIESTVNPYEPLANIDSEPSPRCFRVLGQNSRSAVLEESSFPPLLRAASSSQQRSRNAADGLSQNTMAARLRHHNTVKVLNPSRASPAASSNSTSSVRISSQSRPVLDSGPLSSSSSLSSSQLKMATSNEYALSSHASYIPSKSFVANDFILPSNLASSSRTHSSTSKVGDSSSAPNLEERKTFDKSISNSQVNRATTSTQPLLKVKDIQPANKVLVEKIRAALDFDEDKLAAFRVISVEYRQDLIDTGEYLAYVHQFGLIHLVLELAMLCPNAQKQRELVEIHKYNTRTNTCMENSLSIDNGGSNNKISSKKGKEKCDCNGIYSAENALAESLNGEVMNTQLNHEQCVKEVKVLRKDVCHSAKGKSKILVDEQGNLNFPTDPRNKNDAQSGSGSSEKHVGPGGGGNKPPEVLPIHGVWRNCGGRRLVVMSQRDRKK